MNNFGPVVPSFGPQPCRIAILAEAPGSDESEALRPLVGPSGRELRRMLRTVGIHLDDCFKTNVFSRQPDRNAIELYGLPDPDGSTRRLGPLTQSPRTWLDPKWLGELDRLRSELEAANPNVVLALGNTACWAMLGQIGITNLRGSTVISNFLSRPVKVVPTYHPAMVLREWSLRVVAIGDMEKARAESESRELMYDNTELWLEPTLDDLEEFGRQFMQAATICAVDVETKRGQIDCISLAPRPDVSICVPFWCRDGANYWPDEQTEHLAWTWVRYWIESAHLIKVMQNGMFDIQYLIRHGMTPRNCTADTMLAHHSLYPELRKGLGFLGSVYSNVPAWKNLRTFRRDEELKRDA